MGTGKLNKGAVVMTKMMQNKRDDKDNYYSGQHDTDNAGS